jgi:hypothetical protein
MAAPLLSAAGPGFRAFYRKQETGFAVPAGATAGLNAGKPATAAAS